ncbi:unnamed protein product [Symbiodinium sp. CCMP2592]|nr:unnamed protein product [Symbiodinium sp. CCMP2592]
MEQDDAELQQAILLSLGVKAQSDQDRFLQSLASAPDATRKLLVTVAKNLSISEPSSEARSKFRRLRDETVRSRTSSSYSLATEALLALGFRLETVEGSDNHWQIPAEAEPSAEMIRAVMSLEVTDAERTASMSLPPRVPAATDCDVLELPSQGGLPKLRLVVYPRNYCQLVPEECVAWATRQGSGRSRWGCHGRVGEDDRVILALGAGAELLGGLGFAAHWYNHRGQERSMPTLSCHAGEHAWAETHINQTFVIRALPQQQLALCGLRLSCRPFETSGRLVAVIAPCTSDIQETLRQCQEVLKSLPEDSREQSQAIRSRPPPPPPPSHKHFRF